MRVGGTPLVEDFREVFSDERWRGRTPWERDGIDGSSGHARVDEFGRARFVAGELAPLSRVPTGAACQPSHPLRLSEYRRPLTTAPQTSPRSFPSPKTHTPHRARPQTPRSGRHRPRRHTPSRPGSSPASGNTPTRSSTRVVSGPIRAGRRRDAAAAAAWIRSRVRGPGSRRRARGGTSRGGAGAAGRWTFGRRVSGGRLGGRMGAGGLFSDGRARSGLVVVVVVVVLGLVCVCSGLLGEWGWRCARDVAERGRWTARPVDMRETVVADPWVLTEAEPVSPRGKRHLPADLARTSAPLGPGPSTERCPRSPVPASAESADSPRADSGRDPRLCVCAWTVWVRVHGGVRWRSCR